VFTRDLRVHDHPALVAACRSADALVPVFVLDDAILRSRFYRPNRARFLADALVDLDERLRARGSRLVIRHGRWAEVVVGLALEVAAGEIHVSDDVSAFAQRRLAALTQRAAACGIGVHRHPGVTVVAPGALVPAGGDHYRVFTPYHRRWVACPWRGVLRAPARLPPTPGAAGIDVGELDAAITASSPALTRGGETAGRRRLMQWAAAGAEGYEQHRDDLAADGTSHLGAFLHFGCVSPLEVALRVRGRASSAEFVRQLCWRDFFHQALAARPGASWSDYRPRRFRWSRATRPFAAWTEGRTGYPLVDASMRQLVGAGFVPNRARMVAASFLTKHLGIDWRRGAAHFLDWLVDGDVANNNLSWQWVAGTGTDSDPRRVFNPTRQAERFDPAGDYVRRWVPELSALDRRSIHEPDAETRRQCGYPAPIVDHREALAEYAARQQ
jgi:deoxyribodipyrimidine photo-lyase